MDEFRAPRRPVRAEGYLYDVPARARATQTPSITNSIPTPTVASGQVTDGIVNSPSPGVNPSLLGGFTPPQPLQPATVPVPVRTETPAASPVSEFVTTPAPVAPVVTDFSRDFNMPRPQAIAQEAAVVAESAQAAEQEETTPQPRTTSPFDLHTIEEEDRPKNRLIAGRAWRKWAMGTSAVVLCLLLGTGGLLFAQGLNKTHKVFRGSGASASLASAKVTKLKGEDAGRVNILLLGNGGLGHEAPDLTDTIIIASIDTVHHTVSMLSVPRDLWVQVPGSGSSKINAAYEIGKYNEAGKIDNTNNNTKAVLAGFSKADQVIKNVMGIDINYNVLVNFTSFKQSVDAVGGVTVNVPEQLYDPTMAWENGGNPVLAAAGTQMMDGNKALMYVRSRETSSDFARSQRQRAVILALKNKVLTAGTLSNPLKVSGLINAFGDNMVTDMTLAEGMRAYDIGKGIDNTKIQTVDLVTPPNNLVTTSSMQNVSIVVPRAGMYDYSAIQQYIQQLFNPPTTAATAGAAVTAGATATNAPENALLAVFNGTTKAGLASAQAAVLKAAGYNVPTVGNAPSPAYAKTVIVELSNGAHKNTRKYLETHYGVTAVTVSPDPAIQAGSANFIVILGSDQVH
jgi:LCP family protein required for cell wall assembly